MSTNSSPPVERHCDVAVVGGSAAGLAAALQLARQRRSVIVIDAGDPRNAPAAHMHGYLGHDGAAPTDLTDAGRDEVRRYGGEVLAARVEAVARREDGRFQVRLPGGHRVVARRVLAATGLTDELPDIEGLREHWGADVIHCPFCHGYEVRDSRIVQILTHPMGLHPASLFRQLSDAFTVVVHDPDGVDASELDALRSAGVDIVEARVRRVLTGDDGRVAGVEIEPANGDSTRGARTLGADAVVISPRFAPRIEAFAPLGAEATPHPSGLGTVLEVDATGATKIDGLYAAGNVADPGLQVLHSAAEGSRVGAMIAFSLAHEDIANASRPSAHAADWDERYGEEHLWSGNPNGTLVAEVGRLRPGSALDVGAGEGADALWLAEQGWEVTATDISSRALGRLAVAAAERGQRVECVHADANARDPFGGATFDLVSAQYASIPRTGDDRGVHNLLDAVAAGGTLLVVGHDPEAMRAATSEHHVRPFDPDAYLGVDEVARVLATRPEWHIEIHHTRPRPPGAASGSHHVDDVVLRARRTAVG